LTRRQQAVDNNFSPCAVSTLSTTSPVGATRRRAAISKSAMSTEKPSDSKNWACPRGTALRCRSRPRRCDANRHSERRQLNHRRCVIRHQRPRAVRRRTAGSHKSGYTFLSRIALTSSQLIPHRHRPGAEFQSVHEFQVDTLRQSREQRRPVAGQPGMDHELVLIDQSQLR
jgi:hypothetical protein